MGMYTELYLACQLGDNTTPEVEAVLDYLFNWTEEEPTALPDHEFFQCERWSMIGRSCSHYFVPQALSTYKRESLGNMQIRTLITRCDLKNYGGEILRFMDWLHPYIDALPGEHLGHFRYEEHELPTLLLKGKDEVQQKWLGEA